MREKAAIHRQKATIQFYEVIDSLQESLILNGYLIKTPVWDNLSLEDMLNERWIDIPNYNGYLVSNYGRIKSLPKNGNGLKEKILKQDFTELGYLHITMSNKKEQAHRVIGFSFLANERTKEKHQINHLRGLKWFNALFNLEWSTPGDNQRHAIANGLKQRLFGKKNFASIPINQYNLNGEFIREWESMKMAARDLDFDDSPIAKCCRLNINYSQAYGFIWRLKNEENVNRNLREDEFQKKSKPKFEKRRATTNRIKAMA